MSNVSSSNSHKVNTPILRFHEFTEDWKQITIGDIYDERSERGSEEMELLSVTMNEGIKRRSEIEGKDNSSDDKSNYKIVHIGDMVYNSMRMWQGASGISQYHGIVSPAYTVLKPKMSITNEFFAALFKTRKLVQTFQKNSQGLTSDTWNLKYPQIAPIKISVPNLPEQNKIAKLLTLLDLRIKQQERLVSFFKSYKRGVFSQLYDIFLSKAQEVKLCDIVECLDSQRIPINSSERAKRKGIYPYYGANGIQDYIDQYIFDGEFVLLAEDGGHFDDFNENAIAQYVRGKIWVNNHAHILQTNKCNIKFLYYMLEHKDIRSYINGTSRSKLNQEDMMQISISLPSETIQTKIVTLLSGIDNNIILAETIYQELVEYKSGLLQQLFI